MGIGFRELLIILLIALLSTIGATLTLPGIAGIVLTMGVAVDSNVLIFERIREELRDGKSPARSVELGFERAFSAILDSNVTGGARLCGHHRAGHLYLDVHRRLCDAADRIELYQLAAAA